MEPNKLTNNNYQLLGNIVPIAKALEEGQISAEFAHQLVLQESQKIEENYILRLITQHNFLEPPSNLAPTKVEVKAVQKLPLQMQKQLAFGQLCKLFEFLAEKKIYDLSQGHLIEWSPKAAALFTLSALKQWKMQDVVRFAAILLFQKHLNVISDQSKGKKSTEKAGLEYYLNQNENFQAFKELLETLSKLFEQLSSKQPTTFDFSKASKAEFLTPLFNLIPSIVKQVDVLSLPLDELNDCLPASNQSFNFDQIFGNILGLHKESLQQFNLFHRRIEKSLVEIKNRSTTSKQAAKQPIKIANGKAYYAVNSGFGEKHKIASLAISSGIYQLITFLEKQKSFNSTLNYFTSQDYLREDRVQALDFKYSDLEESSNPFRERIKTFIAQECDRIIEYNRISLTKEEQTEESIALLTSYTNELKQPITEGFKQAALKINSYILDQFNQHKVTLDEINHYNEHLFTRDINFLLNCIENDIVNAKEISKKIKEHINRSKISYPQWAPDLLEYAIAVLSECFSKAYMLTKELQERRSKELETTVSSSQLSKKNFFQMFLAQERAVILSDPQALKLYSQFHESTETPYFSFYLSNYLMDFRDRTLESDSRQEVLDILEKREETEQIKFNRQVNLFYENIKSEMNAVLNGYQVFVENFFPLYHTARQHITVKALPKDVIAYSWLLHIDAEPVKIKRQLPQPIHISSSQVEQSDSDEEAAVIIETQKPAAKLETQEQSRFLSPLQATDISTYQEVLLADERIHAHHLICTLDLIAQIQDIDPHRNLLTSLLIHHLYHATEQLLTRTSSDPYYARHNLKELYGKRDLALSWINEGTIDIRYPQSNLLYMKKSDITPSFSLNCQIHSMTEQKFSELLNKTKSLIDFNLKRLKSNGKEQAEEMLSLYNQALEKLEKLLTVNNLVEQKSKDAVSTPKPKMTASELKVVKVLASLKSTVLGIQEKFHIESASTVAEGRQKDLLVHLKRIQDLMDLVSLYPKQQFLSLFESMFSIAAQYTCELLGSLETNLKGYFIDGHLLENLIQDLKWETTLGVQTCQTLKELSRKKALDYPFGDIYRHPKRDMSNLQAFSKLYELSWIARTEGDGYVSHKVKNSNQIEKLLSDLVKRWSEAVNALNTVAQHVYQQTQKTVE